MPEIIHCADWGAHPPRAPIQTAAGQPDKIIIHHTAGHAPEIADPANESREEATRYVRAIQAFQMGPQRGWLDTGQSFTVCRNGLIFEGRHGTVDALLKGRMVISAHCPGQNDQPGIEHEHNGSEPLTQAEQDASAWLCAWICEHTTIRPTELYPHRQYYATSCPTQGLVDWLPTLRIQTAKLLSHPSWYELALTLSPLWAWITWRDHGAPPSLRPSQIPARVPVAWWGRYALHRGGA